ncbi:MAG: pyruvate carboxyltransferase [Candidatus Methanomethylicia archaeon]
MNVEIPWKTDKWWVSYLNFIDEIRRNYRFPGSVRIHDVTLRDGEQQAGIVFRKEDKVRIARMLDEAGIDRIEAGMPAVSREDMEAAKEIAHEGLKAKVYCFTRCMKADVDIALKCDVEGIEMEIPSSIHLIEHAYKWPLEKALELPIEATNYAAEHGLKVAFFTIDGTRADMDWWFRIISKVATEGHMDSLVVVDTFGVCTPEAIRYYVRRVKERIPNKPIEVHCHNDFGLAVANTLAAVSEGAEIVHTTVNGIGERMGNADLAQTALALKALYGLNLNLKLEKLYELSRLVEELSGVKQIPNAPVTGEKVYWVESGIVASWWLQVMDKDPLIMFPYSWNLIGQKPPEIILGKKSGVGNIQYILSRMGINISEEKAAQLLVEVKEYSIRKKGPLTLNEFNSILKKYL